MKYSEKIASLEAVLPYHEISKDDLPSIGSKIVGGGKVYFECNTQFFSPVNAVGGSVLLGSYSYQNEGGYVRENVSIGRYCSIGRRVSIGAMSHELYGVSTSPSLRRGAASKKYNQDENSYLGINNHRKSPVVAIGHDVWIGDGVIILTGCSIGQGAVIAANAVIRDNVEPYSIVGGVPAKVLKKRFPQEIISELLSLEIYERTNSFLKSTPLDNVFDFIDSLKSNPPIYDNLSTYRLK